MPHVPVVERPASLEANLLLPLRKPHNAARKRDVKKLKVSEDTILRTRSVPVVDG
jgi:hypothetical protein